MQLMMFSAVLQSVRVPGPFWDDHRVICLVMAGCLLLGVAAYILTREPKAQPIRESRRP